MSKINYPLSEDTWEKEELEEILKVVASGQFTMGKKVKEFEEKFANYFETSHAVMVNSGSSANLIAIAALVYSGKLNKGDEILVPAVSWSTTYYPLQQYGLKMKFIDIVLETLNVDTSSLERAITEKTKGIFAVNLLGNPNDFNVIENICKKNNLILIEDNCEALGAKFDGKPTGTFGKIGTFSTFYSHHICTMEGGIAVTNDEELYHYMLAIRAHGWTRQLPNDSKIYKRSDDDFYELFNFVVPGYNLRPLEIEAAIGIKQIDKIERIVKIRRENAKYFKEKLIEHPGMMTQKEIGESSWFGFPVILKDELYGKRKMIVDRLRNNGIEVRPIVAGNFTRNKVIEYMDYEIFDKLLNADYIHENGFFVGNHSKEIKKEIDLFFNVISEIERDEMI